MSTYGITVTTLATGLSEAVLKDEAPEAGGFDLSAGMFGRHVSDWLREVATSLTEGVSPVSVEQPDMTLRDYFAAHCGKVGQVNQEVAERLMGRPMPDLETETAEWFAFWFEVEAKLTYMRSDAFLKVRGEGHCYG